MQKWEYLVELFAVTHAGALVEHLVSRGDEGWQLASHEYMGEQHRYLAENDFSSGKYEALWSLVFMRPKE